MIILVEGTKSFNDYNIFMHGMSVALSTPSDDGEIQVWSLGPHKINSFTASFCNSSENFLRQKGYKITFSKVFYDWVEKNIDYVSYYAFFANPNESLSKFFNTVKTKEGIEVGIFKY